MNTGLYVEDIVVYWLAGVFVQPNQRNNFNYKTMVAGVDKWYQPKTKHLNKLWL